MKVQQSVDVLIVGAGPTGLMLAKQLARHGVHPLIIDRNSGPSLHSKALAEEIRSHSHRSMVQEQVRSEK